MEAGNASQTRRITQMRCTARLGTDEGPVQGKWSKVYETGNASQIGRITQIRCTAGLETDEGLEKGNSSV